MNVSNLEENCRFFVHPIVVARGLQVLFCSFQNLFNYHKNDFCFISKRFCEVVPSRFN